jgi:type II secretory ATPase GspE/PulE/Tfp pilus assembly ATPase PilB-like protein
VTDFERYIAGAASGMFDPSVFLQNMVREAKRLNASDIHMEPWEDSLVVRFRVLGMLQAPVELPLGYKERMVAAIRIAAGIENVAAGLPSEGRIPPKQEFAGVELRVSILPVLRGEKVVLRIFSPTAKRFALDTLGFSKSLHNKFTDILDRPGGLILFTGPSGSGKTTTMYASLAYLQTKIPSISTIEDPVEYALSNVSQTQVDVPRGLTFANALRNILRQDPQVIMVGEVRDLDTAQTVVGAGLTGHLVLSTVHGGSAVGVVVRMLHLGVEPYMLAYGLVGVLGLRLLRVNCVKCSKPYNPSARLVAFLPVPWESVFMKGTGCPLCNNTGFYSRQLLVELLDINDEFKETVLTSPSPNIIRAAAERSGLVPLWNSGLELLKTGKICLEELLRVVGSDVRFMV